MYTYFFSKTIVYTKYYMCVLFNTLIYLINTFAAVINKCVILVQI